MASPFSSPTPGTEAPVGQLTRLIPGSIYSSLRLAHESERDDTATTPPPLGALGDTPPPARFSRDFKIHDQKTKDKLAAEAMEMPSVGISYDLWMSSFTPTLPTATPGSPALSSSKYLMDKINCCGPEAPSYCKLVRRLRSMSIRGMRIYLSFCRWMHCSISVRVRAFLLEQLPAIYRRHRIWALRVTISPTRR